MKILLLNLLMNVAVGATETPGTEDYQWLLDEMNMEMATLTVSIDLDEKVKIFDKSGNLVEEILKTDLNDSNIEKSEYQVLSKSAHMFDYLGDSYYLLEK